MATDTTEASSLLAALRARRIGGSRRQLVMGLMGCLAVAAAIGFVEQRRDRARKTRDAVSRSGRSGHFDRSSRFRTQAWAHDLAAELNRTHYGLFADTSGNALAEGRAERRWSAICSETNRRLERFVGTEVMWELVVEQVDKDRVYLDERLRGTAESAVPGQPQVSRLLVVVDSSAPRFFGTVSNFLTIGDEVPMDAAERLRPGDAIRVRSVIKHVAMEFEPSGPLSDSGTTGAYIRVTLTGCGPRDSSSEMVHGS